MLFVIVEDINRGRYVENVVKRRGGEGPIEGVGKVLLPLNVATKLLLEIGTAKKIQFFVGSLSGVTFTSPTMFSSTQ